QEEEVTIVDVLSTAVALTNAVAVEEHADRAAEAGIPVLWLHLGSVGPHPRDVGHGRPLFAAHGPPVEEASAAEGGVLAPQPCQRSGELDERLVDRLPVHPRDLVVLRV